MPESVRLAIEDHNAPTPPLEEFLTAYYEDDNVFWQLASGHHQNLLDEAVDRMQQAERHEDGTH